MRPPEEGVIDGVDVGAKDGGEMYRVQDDLLLLVPRSLATAGKKRGR